MVKLKGMIRGRGGKNLLNKRAPYGVWILPPKFPKLRGALANSE
jgi:hypothetical protein